MYNLKNNRRSRQEGVAIKKETAKNKILMNYELYLFLLPTLIILGLFNYWPLYGIQIAFKDFLAVEGILGSPWVGLDNFQRLFKSYIFWDLLKNTLSISIYSIVAGFPLPILLALFINHLTSKRYKKIIQTVTYIPHFISTVVLVGMTTLFLSPRSGIVNHAIKVMGMQPIIFMGKPAYFAHIYVWSDIWKDTGWASIIYHASLTGVNVELHEAAIIDGATKFQRIWRIDFPLILPTVIIMFILRMGKLMSVGFEKVFLMQNPANLKASEIISTYVYKIGLLQADYSYSTAVGLFNSVINLAMISLVNKIAKSLSENSLF